MSGRRRPLPSEKEAPLRGATLMIAEAGRLRPIERRPHKDKVGCVFEVVVATPDVVGERMAGPGIRVTYFARELAKIPGVNMTVVSRVIPRYARDDTRAIFDRADVLIGQPARGFRKRRRTQKVVYDKFDPPVLELRGVDGAAPSLRQRVHLA